MEKTIHMQIKNNSHSIEHILGPISYISWLMGFGAAHPRKFPKVVTIIIRVFHLAVCIRSMMYTIDKGSDGIMSIYTFKKFHNIVKFVDRMHSVITYALRYYYIYYGISQCDKWLELMSRLEKLDQKIRMEISMDDKPIKNVQMIAIVATLACSFMIPTMDVLYYDRIYSKFFVTYYLRAQELFNSFVFNIIVYVLYCRIQSINKSIGQLDKLSDYVPWIAFKIRRIRGLHNSICDLVTKVNDIYGVYLFLCSTKCFIAAVTAIFFSYIGLVENNYYMIMREEIDWILYVTQFGLMCRICTLANEEFQRTGTLIYGFVLNSKYLNKDCVRNEVNDFSIQLQLYRVSFKACNFFEINNALFSCFVGIIISNLMLFIQFYEIPLNLPIHVYDPKKQSSSCCKC
ncbi:uncharacterized protein LOC113003085 [Solenopsis invicta]|uniref:uncharacterized protein LOC113003085 n=1 Tax=Solenopsis invicta TaxID=13686 RepID=UPI00193E7002|nr:uncharacterized protein LOC113003085 [Solenopsis invicta]